MLSVRLAPFLLLSLFSLSQVQCADQCACAKTSSLNVRSGPGTTSEILHTLAQGECLPFAYASNITERIIWYKVDYFKRHAWVRAARLNITVCADAVNIRLPGCPWIVRRAEWGARAPCGHIPNLFETPVYVVIHHTKGNRCNNYTSCKAKMRTLQTNAMAIIGRYDIGYNFAVGEDGNVYEALGWNKEGACTYLYDPSALSIALMGYFNNNAPSQLALNRTKQLIQCGLNNGKISQSYRLKGHRDLGFFPEVCPGNALYNIIQTWPNYENDTRYGGQNG